MSSKTNKRQTVTIDLLFLFICFSFQWQSSDVAVAYLNFFVFCVYWGRFLTATILFYLFFFSFSFLLVALSSILLDHRHYSSILLFTFQFSSFQYRFFYLHCSFFSILVFLILFRDFLPPLKRIFSDSSFFRHSKVPLVAIQQCRPNTFQICHPKSNLLNYQIFFIEYPCPTYWWICFTDIITAIFRSYRLTLPIYILYAYL